MEKEKLQQSFNGGKCCYWCCGLGIMQPFTISFAETDLEGLLAVWIYICPKQWKRFDASLERYALEFKPAQREMEIQIGATGFAFYEAYNPTDRPVAEQQVIM